ncbi:MAG: hypothetical protein JSW39_13440 [Desulfobacterales bacterium]|nr:MAG: hypothetical protein JSW39_13440 [Desulfobacterales bacterium]
MKREITTHRTDLSLDDVKRGDVLLSCGRGEFSNAIRLLDGGDYSHAAFCVGRDRRAGPKIVEATRKGVMENPLAPDITGQEYVDVYRFTSDTGENFGSAGWPDAPVIARAHYYKDRRIQYAYDQLFMLSALIMVRKAPLGKLGRANIRFWLDRMIRCLRDDLAGGKTQVTCAELVYRCFYEAEAIPTGKYGLSIRGTLGPDGALVKTLGQADKAIYPELDAETQQRLREAEDLFWKLCSGLHRNPEPESALEAGLRSKAPNPNVYADLVTPRDLQMSSNLELMGRLRG